VKGTIILNPALHKILPTPVKLTIQLSFDALSVVEEYPENCTQDDKDFLFRLLLGMLKKRYDDRLSSRNSSQIPSYDA